MSATKHARPLHVAALAEELRSDAEAVAVFEAAQAYEGRDERVQKLIKRLLATDDFEVFCKMMRDRYEILEIFNS